MLKLYIISTAICFFVTFITSKALTSQLKREGYETQNQSDAWEIIHSILPLFIPFLNIFIAFVCIACPDYIRSKIKEEQ